MCLSAERNCFVSSTIVLLAARARYRERVGETCRVLPASHLMALANAVSPPQPRGHA